jgi:replicative DNA helicase
MKKEGSNEYFQRAFDASKKRKKQITHNYGNLSIDEIVSFSVQHAHSLSRENKQIDFIVIDYLQIIKMQNKRDAHLEIGEITGKLKQLAKMLNCAVLCLSQLNRAIEGIGDKRPVLQHLRQSGKIEEDADMVLFPYRPSYYERDTDESQREWCEDYFEIIVEKNRVGNKGIAKIKCNMAVNFFENGEFDQKSDNAGRTGNVRKSDNKREY